ncbi:MAG: insulinase family protein [Firmicutes bacterium]|nr:insulinase family protein [Bacillota bacterium]
MKAPRQPVARIRGWKYNAKKAPGAGKGVRPPRQKPARPDRGGARLALVAMVLGAVLAIGVAPALLAQAKSAAPKKVFPYSIHKRTLANGLDVVVIETPEFKNVLSFNTLVLAGSRNEVEPGKSGLAHLFEHILFRHRWKSQENGYEEAISRLGAHNNAWTWFDVTFYHPLTFTANLEGRSEDLPGLLALEADRFSRLDFTEKIFRTEAGAVLGEYRRNASFPSLKLEERLTALLFPHHPYGHTTLGYYEDVLDMPNEYAAAVAFYETYYRPNNCVLVIAGDVRAEEMFAKIEPYYRDWQPKPVPPILATGSPPKTEQREHVPWNADVAPLVWVAYRMPAHKTGSVETAVGQLLPELLVSPAAPLYRKLRFEKQTVNALGFEEGTQGYESFDPRVLILSAQLYKEKYAERGQAYFDEVIADILAGVEELKQFSRRKDARALLETLKSKYRYDFLAAMSSPANIAQTFAWYYRFERDPEVFEKLLASVERLTPRDIDQFARRQFVPEHRVVLTLAYEAGARP